MIRRVLVVAFALAPALAPFAACGGNDGRGTPEEAGVADDVQRRDAYPAWDSGPPADVKPERPPPYVDTSDWVPIPFDPAFNCGFYAAPSPEKMPPAIQWEPCDPTFNQFGWACRQIVFDWPPPEPGLGVSVLQSSAYTASVDSAGRAWLVLVRYSGLTAYVVVGEADGPVHMAIAEHAVASNAGTCGISNASLSGGKVTFTTSRQKGSTIYRWGGLGGDVDKLPLVLESYDDGIGRGYAAGPNAYFTIPEYALRTWTAPSSLVAKVSTPSPGEAVHFAFVGDAMFFPFGNLAYHRISLYTPDAGTQDFISYGNDVSKGASDFGTDGKDMVWTEALGRSSTSEPWTTIDIMTAPFTTDPAAIQKRRLRSEVRAIGAFPFVVGCGYAAHAYSASGVDSGTRLVRLSDGRSWRFKLVYAPTPPNWVFNGPLAITCDELFVSFHRDTQFNVARIRLDSLGPGEPAD